MPTDLCISGGMASIETIKLSFSRCVVDGDLLAREPIPASDLESLPQVVWSNGLPWREANLWLYERARSRNLSIKTVSSNAKGLKAYANWLELADCDWWHFPSRYSDRCLVRFRGALINARNRGDLAPSTASQRMSTVIGFYRWLNSVGLISPDWPMWSERVIGVRIPSTFGIERTISVNTTDLAIPNRSAGGSGLEDGLMPVSSDLRKDILELARTVCSEELYLMLCIGFFSGMRIGSICDLKASTLTNAVPDPNEPRMHWVPIGPTASPPVSTKFSVSGQVIMPTTLLNRLRDYTYSSRRLSRLSLANDKDSDLLFLTKFGSRYIRDGADTSTAINNQMCSLRKKGLAAGLPIKNFKFHQSRATFGTTVAALAIQAGGQINSVALVKQLLLQKSEETALKYIKFIEKAPIKAALANEFTKEFFSGLIVEASVD